MTTPRVVRVNGALVEARPLGGAALYELMRVGERRLLGEVVRIAGDLATLQVYDDTSGLRVGEPVAATGRALEVELGPGLLGAVLDGVGRPLERMAAAAGPFLAPGAEAATLDPDRRWEFRPALGAGDRVGAGDVLGTVEEYPGLEHRILVPPGVMAPGVELRLTALDAGRYRPWDELGQLENGTVLHLAQRWPARQPRPISRREPASQPFLTGQRVLDFLFPIAEGGTVAVPGGFGTGKTIIEQSLARYGDADLVVYVGCGERGNEMAELLDEFPRLVDPRNGRPVMERTVMVVNTSNMPVAAREASVYLGITIAEYFRDQGRRVAVMADSLSRWAEALREVAARLGEMPGEEGYPTALGNRLAKIYERAGSACALGRPERSGALTFVSAISPPGGDLSEPVTQAALRVVGALWSLDAALAHQRQFPAVDCETSWTLYEGAVMPAFAELAGADWPQLRREVLDLLGRERALAEIAGLVGAEALQDRDRLELESARIAREVLLGQSAHDPDDATSPVTKTRELARLVLELREAGRAALARGLAFEQLELARARSALKSVRHAPAAELAARAAAARAALASLAVLRGVPS